MLFLAVLETMPYMVPPADLRPVLLAFQAPVTKAVPNVTQAALIAFLDTSNYIALHAVSHAF